MGARTCVHLCHAHNINIAQTDRRKTYQALIPFLNTHSTGPLEDQGEFLTCHRSYTHMAFQTFYILIAFQVILLVMKIMEPL